jgi:hypothetical protein
LRIDETGSLAMGSAALALDLTQEGEGMTTEDAGELDRSHDSAAETARLVDELQLLHAIRDGLKSQPGSDVMVEATTGLIEERQAELERSRRPLV